MEALLRIEDLRHYFVSGKGIFKNGYTIKAVDGVSFTLQRGETLGLVGNPAVAKAPLAAPSSNSTNQPPAKYSLKAGILRP